ncbi:MAG: FkbM family methyltransferase [Phenylobacterium sp.]
MSAAADPALIELLGLAGKLQVADIGAAYISEEPPYKRLVEMGAAHLNAFDADLRQHPKLREVFGEDMTLFTDILGDGTRQTLHLAAPESGMTSLLKPSAKQLAFFNGFSHFGKVHGTEEVATTRLDEVAGLPDLDFLKMDIQGSELQVLEHGMARLRGCCMIQLEVSFVPLYEAQPTFGDIDRWMRAQGYIPHCFTEVKRWSIAPLRKNNNIRQPFNQLLEADIVYAKDMVSPEKWEPDMLKKTAILAHYCYRSTDLAGRLINHLQSRGDLAPGSLDQYLKMVNPRQ